MQMKIILLSLIINFLFVHISSSDFFTYFKNFNKVKRNLNDNDALLKFEDMVTTKK